MKEGNVLWWWEGNSQCKQFLVPMWLASGHLWP
jgi:hypothetical protein